MIGHAGGRGGLSLPTRSPSRFRFTVPLDTPPPPPPDECFADPTLLALYTAQGSDPSAYNALNVPGLSAGQSYNDPVTGRKIIKLTSASFPTTGGFSWGGDYGEFGHVVSLPHTGLTRSILVRRMDNGDHYLLDFHPSTGVSNGRQLTGGMEPETENAFTFSFVTPHYAYIGGQSTAELRRYDVRDGTHVTGSGFPLTNGNPNFAELANNFNDTLFTWGSNRDAQGHPLVQHMYKPSVGTHRTRSQGGGIYINRALDADNAVIAVGGDQSQLWNYTTDTLAGSPWPYLYGNGLGAVAWTHGASMRGFYMGPMWFGSPAGNGSLLFSPSGASPTARVSLSANPFYSSGFWRQANADPLDDWYLAFSLDGGAPDAIVLCKPSTGEKRLVCHDYNTRDNSQPENYFHQVWAKCAGDGLYVLFHSNMNGASRTDSFLVEIPVTCP